MFRDRKEAGERLATALNAHLASEDMLVLGIPRGGIVVAEAVARATGARLDVVVPRKIGAPHNPELAVGAIAPSVRVFDESLIEALGVSDDYLQAEVREQEAEIARRTLVYREGRPPADLVGKTVVVVDDGAATGATAVAAARWARSSGAARVILAVPVAPAQTRALLAAEADEVVVLETPSGFRAVGEWYEHFDQTSDEEVISSLRSIAEDRA